MKRSLLITCLLLLPTLAHASLQITEVQYNPQGTDKGYEWIEVQNISDQPLDLREIFLKESDVNHRISREESGLLNPGEYAVVADRPTFVSSSTAIYDSAFTLINSGESLAFVTKDGTVLTEHMYDPTLGGNGDGSTYGLVDSTYLQTKPTPGSENRTFQESNTLDSTQGQEDSKNEKKEKVVVVIPSQTIVQQDEKPEPLEVSVGPDRYVMTDVPYTFSSQGNKRYTHTWSLGDGATLRGQEVTHTYQYPGTYIVNLRVKAKNREASDNATVHVIDHELQILSTKGDIRIENGSDHTLSLEGFYIEHASSTFTLPKGLFINARSAVILPQDVTGVVFESAQDLSLFSPSKKRISRHNHLLESLQQEIIVSASSSKATNTALENEDSIIVTGSTSVATPSSSAQLSIKPTFAEASGEDVSQKNTLEIMVLIGLVCLTLLYVGYTSSRSRKQARDTFEDIDL